MIAATQPVILAPGVPGGGIPAPPETQVRDTSEPAQPTITHADWEPPPEFVDEEVMFRKDGTIVWKVDGVRTLLRRPKFKELRVLREEVADLAAQAREAQAPIQDRLRALTKPLEDRLGELAAADPDGSQDEVRAVEDELRTVQASDEWSATQDELKALRYESDVAVLAWFRDGVLVRFGKPVVRIDDPEDLPGWCVDQKFLKDLLDHWSSVPRRPGVV